MLDISTTFIMPLPGTQIYQHPENFGIVLEDRECLTAMEDFPVNHTEELSLPEVCMGRSRFITAVSNKMKAQFEKDLIDPKRIRADFNLAFKYGIAAGYLKFIYGKNKLMVQYYQKLFEFKGLLKEWQELNEYQKKTWIIHRSADFSLLDLQTTSSDEIEILSYSGRFNSVEMAEKLKLSAIEMDKQLEKMSRRT